MGPRIIKTIRVFTPGQAAELNFVARPQLENDLADALRTPGKQIIIYGHSGSGKSSLLRKKLKELYPNELTTRCHASMTFEQLLLDAFDQLNEYYTESQNVKDAPPRQRMLEASYFDIRLAISSASSSKDDEVQRRVIPPQLTPQRLARFLGSKGLCWILEDFHKISNAEKGSLAQTLKVFTDESADYPELHIVAVGAVGAAREVIEYDPEMRTRISELHVPLMTDAELVQLLTNGEKLLQIRFDENLKKEIVRFSSGLASVCHQFGLNICRAASIESTSQARIELGMDQLEPAIQAYVRETSDTLKSRFDRALLRKKVRKYDNGRLILTALAKMPQEGAIHNSILTKIREVEAEYPPSNLTNYLTELQAEDRGGIIRYDPASGRYSFSDPVYHAYAKVALIGKEQTARSGSIESELYKQIFKMVSSETSRLHLSIRSQDEPSDDAGD